MSERKRSYYILVGDLDSWKVAINNRIWGFSDRSKGNWNTLEVGDFLAFYVSSPLKKIIGFGAATKKYIDNTKTWPDEFLFDRSIWNYRINFESFHVVEDWNDGIQAPRGLLLNVGRKKIERDMFFSILSKAQSSWKINVIEKSVI
jgi:predicted RNA-binding protein